ncbi:putative peptidase S10, serine carboxypeptidase, alpha/Beta hydrolase [Helianthus annuus]|uniref:Peptidase S10, serine carboxypeptidase, alpha/Beta hydrolase n=2 Tax=Helianthus annuus TaxID=4232 RepID=A0A251V8E4_HELAN|nr:serine carboxypeptidase-like 17 isoform X1 [Helianthus annuus]KAF5814177.1 putative peptidase S10, serine carboxypeptidase, alpha/Beta hydrolase [Helianthus annuus]KAJ0592847.1 putative peptidase S10, serine carboxypeptidase, alpha/Beta hydrolase [Helianthus annuus]KAJ0600524.1 putative peptidase S10, serine carboxypeptidase, alpha/Beta hydrolase [Helianthus annuus]KAJ0607848.1 putative peptidase S10, serine carboxypeptidase, alpha/Beta hydrolase [Helianthus annuus]KAJ0767912.1 putative pep
MIPTSSLMQLGYLWLVVLVLATRITSQTLVKSLPGYPGLLPFKLETGYIGVGENDTVQLFYYFVESEGNPAEDPLVIWLAGGPGCSALRAFFFEIGPMQFQYGEYRDDVPALTFNPNSWTKVANVIYLDAPSITGFSYAKTAEAMISSDTLSASHTATFLRKFVRDHPKFINNTIYVAGISYSGIVVPMVTEEIYKGNDAGLKPTLNIKGYLEGNPLTDKTEDVNSRVEFAYRMALISYELFESTKNNCNGEYANCNRNNLRCMADITEVNKRVEDINIQQILDPDCDSKTNLVRGVNPTTHASRRYLRQNEIRMIPTRQSLKGVFCRGDLYKYATIWANSKNVQKALHVSKGTVKEWTLCNTDMTYNYGEPSMPAYNFNVQNSVVYHANLTKRNCRALVFSGDHDMMVPHVGTRKWILSLNLTITDSNWEAWYVNSQEAGYKTTYARDDYSLVFATVKGAGHTAPEFKPEECYEMVKRWFVQARL